MSDVSTMTDHGPWNPGLESVIPPEYLRLSTIYDPDNVSTSIRQANELSDYCGLPAHELVAFRPGRLIVHELLIRITADLAVYDGRKYEDLGINFRRIAATILKTYVAPRVGALHAVFEEAAAKTAASISGELQARLFSAQPVAREADARPGWLRLFGRAKAAPLAPTSPPDDERVRRALAAWGERSIESEDEFERDCAAALVRVVSGIAGKHGRIVGDLDLIAGIATTLALNDYGSRALGEALAQCIREAVDAEGYRFLPKQAKPVVMNVKGASASGKSTMRPLQHKLADRLGIPWGDFALISPDIWRKFLLDYEALGPAYKYAGMMAGHEVEIIDRKLDRYMAEKGARGAMSHLLIDRFRFDSFVPESDTDGPVRLLTRFGDLVYMFFMITPPEATVERAWKRGLMVGRYKAVDDLLGHNIEAFSGMPELFFTWALRTDKRVHYEFLDNSIPLGSLPRTVAYGWNGEMNILDIKCVLDIDRFRKVNIRAGQPDEVYDGHSMAAEDSTNFLRKCAELIPAINFADYTSGRVYARMEHGTWVWRDPAALSRALQDHEVRAGLQAVGLPTGDEWPDGGARTAQLEQVSAQTLGAWGANAVNPVAGSFGH